MEVAQSKVRMRRAVYPILLLATLWIVSSVRATPQLPGGGFVGIDKMLHFLVYGLLATTLLRVRNYPQGWKWVLLTVLIVSGAGMLEEAIQSFNPFRSFEWDDFFADSLGAWVAVISYRTLPWYRKILEFRIPPKRNAWIGSGTSGELSLLSNRSGGKQKPAE